ncbi:MAG: hypothetical protein QUV05_06275 [Phycisphaerae bacterium]|nr:hypothetical protein [Phycisphaerae bacterium]
MVPDASWTAEDISDLPPVPVIVVVDDAHRRNDLGTLIEGCLRQNDSSRFLLACRPAFVDGVRHHLRTIEPSGAPIQTIPLPPMGHNEAVQLAGSLLPDELSHLADRLVHAADSNPLIIVVGGRCIATHKIAPEILDRTPEEFRRVALDHLLDDHFFAEARGALRRDVLDILTAIGPVSVEDPKSAAAIGAFLQARSHDVAQMIGELERHGLLLRRGRLVRATPDVLADHLLFLKAIGPNGQPTGFIDNVFQAFGETHLSNILANAAELDWRSAAMDAGVEVLAGIWRDIMRQLPDMPTRRRTDLVSTLHRAAVYTPERVLGVLEWLLKNPQAPEDPKLKALGLPSRPELLQDRICELLKLIATHPDFTRRCVRPLCELAQTDDRPTNPNPEHPRRVLEELCSYDRYRPTECQRTTLDVVSEYVVRKPAPGPLHWTARVFGAALARSGESHLANRRQITMQTYGLAAHIEQIAQLRRLATESLIMLALGPDRAAAVAALDELRTLLDRPHGLFGRQVSEEEVSAWLPESLQALDRFAEIIARAGDAAIGYLARRHLRQYSKKDWPEVGKAVETLLQGQTVHAQEAFYDLLLGIPSEGDWGDWGAQRARASECAAAQAKTLWEGYAEPAALLTCVVEAGESVGAVRPIHGQNLAELACALARNAPSRIDDWIAAILANPSDIAHRLLPAALQVLREQERGFERFAQVVDDVCHSPHEMLRAYTADAFRFLVKRDTATAVDLELLRRFHGDPSMRVRTAAVSPLAQFVQCQPDAAIEAAVAIECDADVGLADELCGLFSKHYGIDPALLRDDQVDQLLSKLESLPHLGTQTLHILDFLAFASTRRPAAAVSLLIRRIEACTQRSGRQHGERYRPIPINAHDLSLPGIETAPDRLEIHRSIRDVMISPDPMVRHHAADLFGAVVSVDSARATLQDWATGNDPDRVIAAARLLGGYGNMVVSVLNDLVADMLDNAARLSTSCYDAVSAQFFMAAIGGVWVAAPGQPSQRHLADRTLAEELAKKYADRAPVRRFYESLRGHAGDMIEREMAEFEEEEME